MEVVIMPPWVWALCVVGIMVLVSIIAVVWYGRKKDKNVEKWIIR